MDGQNPVSSDLSIPTGGCCPHQALLQAETGPAINRRLGIPIQLSGNLEAAACPLAHSETGPGAEWRALGEKNTLSMTSFWDG